MNLKFTSPFFLSFFTASAGCYFPLEFQGEFLTQSLSSREIAYSSVSVLFDSIGLWGLCHRRLGHHVILRQPLDDATGEDGAEDEGCFRCVRMVSRSPNVLQLHSTSFDSCHPSEEAARAACPTSSQIKSGGGATEMMMYKTRSFYGGSAVTRVHCPINGDFSFSYSSSGREEGGVSLECSSSSSVGDEDEEGRPEATDCPTGYKFDLKFKGCSFPDFGEFHRIVRIINFRFNTFFFSSSFQT